ncbi:MAG: DUF3470 domain-containing protein [Gammaproteobacteria bacterium]
MDAIFSDHDVPTDQAYFIALNVELARVWKPIVVIKAAPVDADEWGMVKDKLDLLER